jgi:hypothetical protein
MAAARPSMVLTAMSHMLYTWVVQGGSCRVVIEIGREGGVSQSGVDSESSFAIHFLGTRHGKRQHACTSPRPHVCYLQRQQQSAYWLVLGLPCR